MSDERLRPASKALIERDGKILVLEADVEEQSYLILPGGKVEYGESPVQALRRELREELGCEADVSGVIDVYHFFTGSDDDGDQIVATVFESNLSGAEIDIHSNPAEDYITDYHWLPPSEIIERTSTESFAECIQRYSDQKNL